MMTVLCILRPRPWFVYLKSDDEYCDSGRELELLITTYLTPVWWAQDVYKDVSAVFQSLFYTVES